MSWSGTLRADSPGYHTRTLYTQYPCAAGQHFGDGFNLDIAQTARIRKDVQHWLAVNRRFRGRGVKPDNMRMD